MKLFSLFASLATFVGADNLVARIGKEAPDFEAEAVVDGDFQKASDRLYIIQYSSKLYCDHRKRSNCRITVENTLFSSSTHSILPSFVRQKSSPSGRSECDFKVQRFLATVSMNSARLELKLSVPLSTLTLPTWPGPKPHERRVVSEK